MKQELRILLVEDQPTDAELEIRELKRAGLRVSHQLVETEAAFRESLRQFYPELIISDFSMPHFDGMSALAITRELAPDVPFIFVSGTIGEEYAIRALKNGATDYVLKSNLVRLPAAVERALEEQAVRTARRKAERELEETRSRLDSIVSSLSDVVWSVSIKPYRMLYVSRAIETVWRRPIRAFYDNPDAWMEQVHPDDREQLELSWKGALRGGAFDAVYRIVHENGEVCWIHDRAKSIRDTTGNVTRLDGIARDVTELKLQEQRIARLSRIHAVLSGINSAIVRIRDRQQLFDEACRIAVEHGGFGIAWIGMVDAQTLDIIPAACAGVEAQSLVSVSHNTARADVPLGQGIVGTAVREKRVVYSNDITAETSPGGPRRQEAIRRGYRSIISLPLIMDAHVLGSLTLFAKELNFFDDEEIKLLTELAGDISFALEHIAKSERLEYLVFYDGLTGLANRKLFDERIEHFIATAEARQSGLAVIVVDVERMRNINESLGIAAGDELLRQFARRLEASVRENGSVARLSGDHFGVKLRGAGDAANVAHFVENRVINGLNEPFFIAGQELRVPLKAGVAVYPGDGADAATLYTNAEAALRKAKEKGERFLFYASEMNARVAERLKLENDLRNALLQEQYVLHYQPKFDLASGRMAGMEALIRWKHPLRGMVSPAEFIPLLEETGMILEVGRWALKRAALEHAAWCAQGYRPPRIAVNVSPVQLRRKDFVDYVKDALTGTSGAGECVDIEITESMLMEDIEGSIEKLKSLQGAGMQIALDDFGTGYSSLSYLARLPINSLKIDRSFIVQMPKSPEQMAIVSAVISLARALNLKVVAEGVETDEQANLLRLLRCDEVQGYLFGRPVAPEELEKLLPKD